MTRNRRVPRRSRGTGPDVAADEVMVGVVITVPYPHGGRLRRWRAGFGDPQADRIPPHVTLLPPTVVRAARLAEVDEHLRAAARRVPAFEIYLRGTGTFRPVSPVVFAQLAAGVSECEALEAQVRAGVLHRDLDFPYHPHVTVAHGVPEEALDDAFAALGKYEAVFEVQEFELYQQEAVGPWRLRARFPLTGDPAVAWVDVRRPSGREPIPAGCDGRRDGEG